MSSGNHTFFEGSNNNKTFDEFVEKLKKLWILDYIECDLDHPNNPTFHAGQFNETIDKLAKEYRGKFE